MREYILEAPLASPTRTSDAPERSLELARAVKDVLGDGEVSYAEADALRRWLGAAG